MTARSGAGDVPLAEARRSKPSHDRKEVVPYREMTRPVPRAGHIAYYLFPSLFCLVVYWSALRSWFLQDDFTWLGLSRDIHGWSDLPAALFQPMAQGTVRVFSERVFFLVMHGLFDLHGLPFHAAVFLTQFVNLILLSVITLKLTQSRAAGLLAPILWVLSTPFATSLAWVSAYNQILCACCLLGAFYFLLRFTETGERKFLLAQWIVFLLGFGVLEIIVVYPALALLYTLCFARRYLRTVLPFFVPAILFAFIHIEYIPRFTGPYYRMYFDAGLISTLGHYLWWAMGPEAISTLRWSEFWRWIGVLGAAGAGLALAGFVVWQMWRRKWLGAFCTGWFLLLLLPFLPLRYHIQDYYLTSPAIGLAILGAWAIVSAWRSGPPARLAAAALAAIYVCGSVADACDRSQWFLEQSRGFQNILKALAAAHREHPNGMLLLAGVNSELFNSGFQDRPFPLIGVPRVYLMPGSESAIRARKDLGGVAPFLPPLAMAARGLENGSTQILEISGNTAVPATKRYAKVLVAQYLARNRGRVDVGDPQFASRLGPGWYRRESGFRWMSKSAVVNLAGPDSPGAALLVGGYAPESVTRNGPVILTASADGKSLGSVTIKPPAHHFEFRFPLPDCVAGEYLMHVRLEVNRTQRLPGDLRDLGLVFGTLQVQSAAEIAIQDIRK